MRSTPESAREQRERRISRFSRITSDLWTAAALFYVISCAILLLVEFIKS